MELMNPQTLSIDPEFKSLIRPLTDDEKQELEKSLLEEGCREAIVVWDWVILDGHNRYEICKKHNIEFRIKYKDFEDINEAKEWIIRNQFARRNLSTDERLNLGFKLEEIIKCQAKEKQREHGGTAPGRNTIPQLGNSEKIHTDKELAKIAGVGKSTVGRARFARENATPEQKEQLERGEATYHKVYTEIKEKEKKRKPIPPKKKVQLASHAMEFAVMAISQLERIGEDDPKREKALLRVKTWIENKLKKGANGNGKQDI